MKLLIIGIGDPVPSFIERRLGALGKLGIRLTICLGYRQGLKSIDSFQTIRYGDWRQMGLVEILGFVWLLLRYPFRFLYVYQSYRDRPASIRWRLILKYFPLACVRDVDLVHIQWLALAPDLVWLKSVYRVPVIASARGSQVTVYPFTQQGYAGFIQKALAVTDACHLVANDLRRSVLALGADQRKLFVNYNGIDLLRFKPTRREEKGKALLLISVGALIWRKGYMFQLFLLQQLIERNVSASLTIVGEGGDKSGLMYTSKVLGLLDHITFAGQLDETCVARLLAKSDVYISTSLAEGLPNSVVEAAACGLPVVAFACEGIREVVEHGVTGFVVEPGKIDEMVNYLVALQDETARSKMSQCARNRMELYFDQDKCVAEMIAHYQRIINAG